jgi:sugar-specific transcriptional regulator TrmB
MENILTFLQQLDLSEIEAKLYLNLLKNGPTSVRDLAGTIDIKRTTAYFYIDQLVEKSLVTKLVKGSKKLVAANPPETLHHLVEKKVEAAKKVEAIFPSILDTLTTTIPQANNKNDAEITYYKGKNGVKKIYEEALKTNELRSYVNIEEIAEVFPDNFPLFDNTLKNNENMKMLEIVEDSPQARKRIAMSGKRERYMYKFLPKNMKLTAQDIMIYDDKVAIIHFKDNINGVVLKNIDLNSNFTMLFNIIWEILPESE